ncbi:MAG: acyl carrier protein [Bacteroidetes bacterium]|nr:MAG: acyl carrier protein [Bacteroidota bacterium]
MSETLVLEELSVLFKDVLDNGDISLLSSTTAEDIDEWDSITHMMLVVEIEKKYAIKFTASETRGWNNVGELVKSILQKKS